MKRFRWGIFGTGDISAKFVAGLRASRHAEATFVASRSLAKAQTFASGMGIARAIEGYAEAAAAGGVDAIYVATPPSEHASHAMLCIEAGIPVLVEKPFATTGAEAARIAEAGRAKSVFVMEGMWTRFHPAARSLKDALAAGTIGEPRVIAGNFGSSQTPDPAHGNFDPARQGGAIAHLGAYPLSLGQWLFGSPRLMQALGSMGATGVDEDAAFQLSYSAGVIGSFYVSLRAWAPNTFHVLGTEGMLAFHGPIIRPFGLDVMRRVPVGAEAASFDWRAKLRQHGLIHQVAQLAGRSGGGRSKRIHHRYSGNGFHYEADEVRACVLRGDIESRVMPLADSIAVAATAESIRRAIRESSSPGNGAV